MIILMPIYTASAIAAPTGGTTTPATQSLTINGLAATANGQPLTVPTTS